MGKLFNLKKWLTVPETARHLATLFGEEVTEADVLRLALDRRLRLSVNFVNHTQAKPGKVIPLSEAKTVPGLFKEGQEPYEVVLALRLNEHDFLELDKKIVKLTGVWDLLMMGSEELDIEHKYQQLTGGPAVTLTCLDGAFVKAVDGTICQLQDSYDENEYQRGSEAHLRKLEERIARDNIEPSKAQELFDMHKEERKKFLEKRKAKTDSGKDSENYFPAGGLPTDSVLVVRTDALREFEAAISAEAGEGSAPAEAPKVETLAADYPHPIGLKIIPRQSVVDEEVIAYWKKKRRIGNDEIAALVCGINPFAWQKLRGAFPPDTNVVSAAKQQEIDDVITLLNDRISDPFASYSLAEWKSVLNDCGAPIPEWLKILPFADAIDSAPAGAEQENTEPADLDKELAELFDPVRVEQLEAMFPDDGRWAEYANRAASNALIAARKGRAQFNPYHAARWWLDSRGPTGWKWERCLRVLANNLPTRSRDSKHLLIGDYDDE